MRTARHETTGYSSYYVNFGREHRIRGSDFNDFAARAVAVDLPGRIEQRQKGFEMFTDIEQKIKRSSQRSREVYNLRRCPQHYCLGDNVWRRNKCLSDAVHAFSVFLAPKFLGPFRVPKKLACRRP